MGFRSFRYVKRLQSALEQLNKKANYIFEIKLTSLVNLLNGKQVVKMSKREGNYVTLREVVEKVGPDVEIHDDFKKCR